MRLLQRISLLAALGACMASSPAYSQVNTAWVHVLSSATSSQARCVQATPDGNLIAVLQFTGITDMDPGPLVQNFSLTSPGGSDMFVGKYDTLGHLIWGKVIGGSSNIYPTRLAVSSQGFIHIVGNFKGTFDFDPGPATYNLTASGSLDGDYFIVRLDPTGNFIQAHNIGRNNSEAYKGMAIDAAGNAYYCGNWQYSSDLDPGPGTFNVSTSSAYNGFLIKVDFLGNLVWADVWNAPAFNSFFLPSAVAIGPSGDVYLSAELYGGFDVDPSTGVTTLTSVGPTDLVMMRLDPGTGAMKSVFKGGGTGLSAPTEIVVNSREEIYMSGTYTNNLDLDPGPGTATYNSASTGSQTAFFVAWDSSGQYLWSSAFLQAYAEPFGLAVDANDNMLSTGYFGGTTDFDPGPGVYNLSSASAIYYYSLDRNGAFRWALNAGGQFSNGYDIVATPSGGVYAGFCAFDSNADYDPGPAQYSVMLPSTAGVFAGIIKLQDCLARQTSLSASICEGQAYLFGGQNLTQPGTYTDSLSTAGGCDSIVTLTLGLTPPVQTSQTVDACESYQWGGNLLSASGTYVDTLAAANGCDSIVTLTLTITPPAQTSETVDACESYSWGGNLLSSSGTYTDTLQTLNECDSIITLHLTLHTLSASATLSGATLQASPANALSYQWLLCGTPNTPIPNATSPSFTPTANGSYAVQVTDSFCTATSACVFVQVVARADAPAQASRLLPNPNAGAFALEMPQGAFPAHISVHSLAGQMLWEGRAEAARSPFDLGAALAAGSYMLRIHRADGRVEMLRLVKQ